MKTSFFSLKRAALVAAALLAVVLLYQAAPFVSTIMPRTSTFDLRIMRHELDKETGKEPDIALKLSDIEKPKIVVLWTLGCVPCFQMLATLNKMADTFAENEVEIVPVLMSHDRTRPAVYWGHAVVYLARAVKRGATWKTLFPKLVPYYDSEGLVFQSLELSGTPTLLCLSANNRLVARKEGFQNWETEAGKAELDALLKKMKAR